LPEFIILLSLHITLPFWEIFEIYIPLPGANIVELIYWPNTDFSLFFVFCQTFHLFLTWFFWAN
jgi:hypothetical protein